MASQLEQLYRDHLDLTYTCVDRIFLKGYVTILQRCAGFRYWAEMLRPDEPVTQSWIRSLTRRFHANVKTFARERDIPVVEAKAGQRKHLIADEYRTRFAGHEGVYLIIKGFERTPTFVSEEPRRPTNSNHRNLSRRKAFVIHYSFYIIDRHWGPMCVVISSHPPFNAKVLLNGHHWVERKALVEGLSVDKQTNAFLGSNAPDTLQKLSDSLQERDIRKVADRWTYRVLPILTYKQRHDTRFHYQWSIAQMEVSHNLVFTPAYPLAEMFQRHIDLNRRFLGPQFISTAFGIRRHQSRRMDVSIYQSYESRTVVKVRYGSNVMKQYNKHDRILRTECVCNDSRIFRVRKLLTNFNDLRSEMAASVRRFLELQHAVADSTLDRGELAALAQTSELGRSRVPGIRLDNERIMTVLHLIGRLATAPAGFTLAELRDLYCAETGRPYSASQASYDFRKLRAKHFLARVPETRRYALTQSGARLATLLYKLRSLLIAPTLAAATNVPPTPPRPPRAKKRGPRPQRVPRHRLRSLLLQYAGNVCAVARRMNRQTCVIYRWIERDGIDLDQYRNPVPRPVLDHAYRDLDQALGRITAAIEVRLAA